MANVVKLLKIFDEAAFQSSVSQTSISEVISIVNSAIKESELFTNVYGLNTMATDLMKSIKTRYADLKRVQQYRLTTILVKTVIFLSSENEEHAKELLVEEALELGIDDGVEEASTSKAS